MAQEFAQLRAENTKLQQQNVEWASRAMQAESVEGGARRRSTMTPPSLSLIDMFLTAGEVSEALMRMAWLARYWTLAAQLDICAHIAVTKALYWSALAPSLDVFYNIARQTSSAANKRTHGVGNLQDGISATKESSVNQSSAQHSQHTQHTKQQPGDTTGHDSTTHDLHSGHKATVSDIVELERALRQLQDLGIVSEVGASLAHQAQQARAAIGSTHSGTHEVDELNQIDDPSGGHQVSGLSAAEAEEASFQKAWVAYLWGRASLAAIQPHISNVKSEYWGCKLLEAPTLRELTELQHAMQELQVLSIEQLLWQNRGRTNK